VDWELWERTPPAPYEPDTRVYLTESVLEKLLPSAQAKLLGEGRYHQTPLGFHVIDSEPGVVLYEWYGHNGFGNVLAYIDWRAELRWTLRLEDLFSKSESGSFKESDNAYDWAKTEAATFWVDEERRKILLHSRFDEFPEVDWDTGVVTRTSSRALLRATIQGPTLKRRLALRAAAPLGPDGLATRVRAMHADETLPLELRLEAAIVALYDGGEPPPVALFEEALEHEETGRLARKHLDRARADETLDDLLAALEGEQSVARAAIEKLIDQCGRSALEPLAKLARDRNAAELARLRALFVYGAILPDADLRKLADDAVPLMAGALRLDRGDSGWVAYRVRERLPTYGEAAATELAKILDDPDSGLQVRRDTAGVLGSIPCASGRASLLRVLRIEERDPLLVKIALGSLQCHGSASLAKPLIRLLTDGTPNDIAISAHFAQHPTPAAIDSLLLAMERCLSNPRAGKAKATQDHSLLLLGHALQRCSGKWVAERGDPTAWRRALGR
jgi:hypothetical protein